MKYKPYSFSKIDTYMMCPKKFDFKYVQKIKIPFLPSLPLEKGDFIHCIIEYVLGGQEKLKIPTNSEILDEEKIREILKNTLDFCKSDTFLDIRNYSENNCVELNFSFDEHFNPKPDKDGSILNGKIDFITLKNKMMKIIDWKSGGKDVQTLKRFPKDSEQLEIYALWCFKKFKSIEEISSSYVFIELDYIQESLFTRDDIPELEEKLRHNIQMIEATKEFEPKVQTLCKYCDYKNICPEFSLN